MRFCGFKGVLKQIHYRRIKKIAVPANTEPNIDGRYPESDSAKLCSEIRGLPYIRNEV
jgi:hypothetical protein